MFEIYLLFSTFFCISPVSVYNWANYSKFVSVVSTDDDTGSACLNYYHAFTWVSPICVSFSKQSCKFRRNSRET
jgi:hypothetical protein